LKRRKEQGFTLVELIVVMVILSILAVIAISKFANLTGAAKASATQGALAAVRSALVVAYSENALAGSPSFPSSLDATDFGGANIPINKCNGNLGISTVSSVPGGTSVSATDGFWYVVATGEAGAYANPAISECSNTSGF